MLSRCASLRLPLRFLTITIAASSHSRRIASSPLLLPSSPLPPFYSPSPNPTFYQSLRPFSTRRGDDNDGGDWKFTPDADEADSIFGEAGDLAGIADGADGAFGSEAAAPGAGFKGEDSWEKGPDGAEGAFGSEAAAPGAGFKGEDSWVKGPVKEGTGTGDAFGDIDLSFAAKESVGEGEDEWQTAEGYKPWTFGDDGEKADLFDFGQGGEGGIEEINDGGDKPSDEELKQLEKKEEELLAVLKGPNRAFGDLIAQSGITEDMIDSLILMKDVRGIKGLPPLPELQERAVAKLSATSTRTEIEKKKQEEIAKARVRQVDEKGRAYGTGRRKCSIARVFIKPGDGKFLVNEKQFDSYFPNLDHRSDLLQPFNVTKTLGLWDVNCTVKGGGVSGQAGAIRLGISRALQNWEPGLRPYLKAAGFLTRDPRVVERKKPGKAKARKSFQWVKR